MINKIRNYLNQDKILIKDQYTLFIGMTLLNISGYLFHFIMGRLLGPADYGVLGVLLAIVYFIVIATNVIQTSITKFVSNLNAYNEHGKIAFLIFRSVKKLFLYGLIIAALFILLSPFIASFLHIPVMPLIVLSSMIIVAILLPINRGVLQGLQKFKNLRTNYIIEGVIKLVAGVLLVYFGFGINGAVTAFVLAYFFPFFLAFYPLRKYFHEKRISFNTKSVYSYSLPVIIMFLSLTAFYTIDIVLVKHFLPALEAGYYAAISLFGKVIFFGCFSISQVMFSKSSELNAVNKQSRNVLNKSLMLALFIAVPVTLFYFIFPGFTVNLLFGKSYLEIAPLIGLYAIVMTLFTLVYIIAFYQLSVNKIKFIYLLIIFNVIEFVLIYLYHETLMQVINILLILTVILFIISLMMTRLKNE